MAYFTGLISTRKRTDREKTMQHTKYDFGLVGLGVMGRNFILNVADHGFSAFGHDLDGEKVAALIEEGGDASQVNASGDLNTFVQALTSPRKIMLLVPAGRIVDTVIGNLLPLLEKGDIIIDGGNSFFTDTDRREAALREKGIHFFGAGVSGGAEGARTGPSIMPGGSREAYREVQPVFEAVAAKFNGEPCVAYLGPKSAGNYVKMVHNGIEYGLMQLTSECYDLLKRGGNMSNRELGETFSKWNQGRLHSFLIEITAAIFRQKDSLDEGYLVDKILDKAKQKGTGKWTSQNAMDLGIPIPSIDIAVSMREISALKEQRMRAAQAYLQPEGEAPLPDDLPELVEQALYFSFLLTYAQGMHQLAEASVEYGYELELATIARIWRAGCIIRAGVLEDIAKAYEEDPSLTNFLLSPRFIPEIKKSVEAVRVLVSYGARKGIALPGMSNSLLYFDAFTTDRLPLNLIQAQRDYFGSHTYERTDRDGIFHTDWE